MGRHDCPRARLCASCNALDRLVVVANQSRGFRKAAPIGIRGRLRGSGSADTDQPPGSPRGLVVSRHRRLGRSCWYRRLGPGNPGVGPSALQGHLRRCRWRVDPSGGQPSGGQVEEDPLAQRNDGPTVGWRLLEQGPAVSVLPVPGGVACRPSWAPPGLMGSASGLWRVWAIGRSTHCPGPRPGAGWVVWGSRPPPALRAP